MSTVITAEGLSKKYIISHQKQRRSDTFRDAITHVAKNVCWRALHPLSRNRASVDMEEVWALRDVSFEVEQGERLGIIGRNGAGKTTLLKILSRITEPTTGRVTLRGRASSLLEVGTGFHGELTGRENIYLNGAILGMTKAEIKRKFDQIVAFAEVERFLDTPVKRYSSGMCVRLAFAVAAHLEPEILLVDEVLAVGDFAFQRKCLRKMGKVAEEGRTVLFVSHNMQAIVTLCSSAFRLDGGQIREVGEASKVVEHYVSELGVNSTGRYRRDLSEPASHITIDQLEISDGRTLCTQFEVSTPIHLHINYRVHHPVEGAFLGLQVRTPMGQPIFTSTNVDILDPSSESYVEGELGNRVHKGEASVVIPSELLNVGTYELYVVAFAPGRAILDFMTDVFFEVVDTKSWTFRPFGSTRQGVVLCRVPWKVKRIGGA